jgi:hypothetical protein
MPMKKTIHRRLEFTPDDIKNALLEHLRATDQPTPDGKHQTFDFALTNEGATIAWSEGS